MKLLVDTPQRHAKMRAHTATHLLHHALNTLLWSTKQAWSLVDEDYLRFDFAAQTPLTDENLQQLEQGVNMWIRDAVSVQTTEMSYNQAINTWAKAFFEDKYGDVVRVVSIQHDDAHIHSIELCWGTHVQNTEYIGAFVIIWQEAVASGIRRIIALTWPAVAEHVAQQRAFLNHLAQKLDCQPKQLEEKVDKLTKAVHTLEHTNEHLQHRYFSQLIANITSSKSTSLSWVDIVINLSTLSLNDEDLKPFAQIIRQQLPDQTALLYSTSGAYGICWSSKQSAKSLMQQRKLAWGWNDQYVQWKDPTILQLAL